jgi:aminoglycoside phosphotransferase (APT) family kinase protein
MPDTATIPTVLANAQGEQTIRDWLEANLDGEVVKMERQGRWRPAWFIEMTTNGATRSLYVRGARMHNHLPYGLEREFSIHQLLEQSGVKVPHLQGYIQEVPAIVMDRVPGRHDLRHADSEADRESVCRQLIHQMAKMHRLDTGPFRTIGLRYPGTPRETTLSFFDDVYDHYRRTKGVPNPRLEFLSGWVKRNAPPANCQPRFTACDAGQFMYDGPTLTATMDLELSVLGDPMQDLAALRRRTTYEPIGHIPSLFRMYEEETGVEIDLDAIRFHTVAHSTGGAIGATMWLEQFLAAPSDDGDYVQSINWVYNSTKQAFEGIAEVTGYRFPELEIPLQVTTPAHDALLATRATVNSLDSTLPFRAYQKQTILDIVSYLERVASYGGDFAAEYIDGAARILGCGPRDIAEADELLDRHVRRAGPEDDERLFQLLAADAMRRCFLLAIPGSTYMDGLTKRAAPLE